MASIQLIKFFFWIFFIADIVILILHFCDKLK